MKKSKLFIFISILTIVFLFGTAALIDRCSIFSGSGVDEENIKEVEEESIEKETESEEEAAEETPEEETREEENKKDTDGEETSDKNKEETEEKEEPEDEEPQEVLQVPTIDLLIYEGPTYSEDDDVCYFRIEAVVTGNPVPSVSFSKDDSGGSWGPLKTQINLNSPTDLYTLTATATNSEGTATDSLLLSWGCSPVTRDANNDPIVYDINIVGGTPLYWPESKYGIYAVASDPDGDNLTYEWSVSGGSTEDTNNNPAAWNTPDTGGTYTITVTINDGNGGIANKTITAFISQVTYPVVFTREFPIAISEGGMIEYDSTETHSNIIQQVTTYEIGDTEYNWVRDSFISFDISQLSGEIISAHLTFNLSSQTGDLTPFLPLKVVSVYWGATSLSKPGYAFGTVCAVNNPNFSADNGNLITELLRAMENGQERFQIAVTTGGLPPCDNDNIADLWLYDVDDISLIVTYRS